MGLRWLRRAAAGLAAALTLGVLALGASSATASADEVVPPGYPGDTRSHYVTTLEGKALRDAGAKDGADAASVGLRQALVILDFGSPYGDDGTVRLVQSGLTVSTDGVHDAVLDYVRAWRSAAGPRLILVVGTTNYGNERVSRAHGAAWGLLIARLDRDVADAGDGQAVVDLRGGLDAETEWSGPKRTLAWLSGYLRATDRDYVDFGNCTCPPVSDPPGNWTLEDRYQVATSGGRGSAVPQIYSTAAGNAREWAYLVEWSRETHHDQPVRLLGALTQAAACTGPPVRACEGTSNQPVDAWLQLSERLSRSRLPAHLTDIGYLSAPPGQVHGPLAPLRGRGGLAAILIAVAVLLSTVTGWLLHRFGALDVVERVVSERVRRSKKPGAKAKSPRRRRAGKE